MVLLFSSAGRLVLRAFAEYVEMLGDGLQVGEYPAYAGPGAVILNIVEEFKSIAYLGYIFSKRNRLTRISIFSNIFI